MGERQQFSTFWLDAYLFGLEVHRVQEVVRYQELTRVPLAPAVVRGLINLRGQILMAIDLRRRLQLPEEAPDWKPVNVVVKGEDGLVSLLVDEIGDVVTVMEDTFESPPETLRGITRDLIRGTYKLPQHLLLVLDCDRVINVAQE